MAKSIGNELWLFHNSEKVIYSCDRYHPVPHRLDGPAIEYSNGNKEWYYKGEEINCSTQVEFEKSLKLKAYW